MIADETLTLGLIGAGAIGSLHAAHLSYRIPRADLQILADVVEEAAQGVAKQCRIPETTSDYQRILERPDIEAVVICSPTETHARIIEEAAEAGKHIFCEKPIDLDLGKIDGALTAVEKSGVLLQVGFNRRFDSNFRRVREAIQSGEIGEPHLLHIISRDPAPPPIEYLKVSGDIFVDMTIHDFDMARYLIGEEVEEIYATGGVRIDDAIAELGDLDTVLVVLKFADGTIGTIDNSRQAVYGYDQRVEVLGSKGSIRTANNFPNSAVVSAKDRIYRDLPLHFFLERYVDSYLEEMTQFVDAVLSRGPSPVTGHDGRSAVVLGLAARASYDQNRSVRITEISG